MKHWIMVTGIVFAAGIWSVAAGCSGSAGESCASTEDCFSGEVCVEQVCVAAEDVGNADVDDLEEKSNGDTSVAQNEGGNDTGSTVALNAENTDDADSNGDVDAGNDSSEDRNGAEDTACLFSESGAYSCTSGQGELQGGGTLTLLPDGMDEVGCTGTTGDLSEGFESFDEISWKVQACPERHHRFRLPLQRCVNDTFPAFIRVDPVDDICPLDGPNVSVRITRETSNELEKCGESDHNCYFEKELDDGRYGWVIKPENTSVYSGYSWSVYIHVETEADAYFEYEVTASVPPYPDP